MRGDHTFNGLHAPIQAGPPPRARGPLRPDARVRRRAGTTPRARDHELGEVLGEDSWGPPPRARDHTAGCTPAPAGSGPPACAGTTSSSHRCSPTQGTTPRARGPPGGVVVGDVAVGTTPRARGPRVRRRPGVARPGTTPRARGPPFVTWGFRWWEGGFCCVVEKPTYLTFRRRVVTCGLADAILPAARLGGPASVQEVRLCLSQVWAPGCGVPGLPDEGVVVGESDGLEEVAEVGDVGFDGGDLVRGGCAGVVAARGVGAVTGAAEAVRKGFRWAWAAAVGALDEGFVGGFLGRRVDCCRCGEVGRDFVGEAAVEEAGGGVDVGGESCGEGGGQVVDGDAACQPGGCEGFEVVQSAAESARRWSSRPRRANAK